MKNIEYVTTTALMTMKDARITKLAPQRGVYDTGFSMAVLWPYPR